MMSKQQQSKEKQILINELHKPIRKNFKRRRTIIKGLDDLWQADLAQMNLFANSNKNYKFILIVIDCFSKYVWAKPLKTKTGVEVAKAFESILGQRHPRNLQTDQGKEFFNVNFKTLTEKFQINHYNTFSCKKAAIVERVIRTLKERLFQYFSLNGSYKWLDILEQIIFDYNNTKHSKINMKPMQVTKNNEKQILNTSYNFLKSVTAPRKFDVGDLVRISKAKHVFQKGYIPNWTTELFKIVKINITNPQTYLFEDLQKQPISGAFYAEELQKTSQPDIYLVEKILRKRARKVYVKWLGLDNSHNSWIDSTNAF